jgi:nitrogen fixation NifU-like protein
MSDLLRELYQEVILDHNRKPRNFHALEGANRRAEGYNPLCGDRLTVYARIEEGVIRGVSFEGSGCAISKASASMMTDSVAGKTVGEAERVFDLFHAMVTGEGGRSTPSPTWASSRSSPASASSPRG